MALRILLFLLLASAMATMANASQEDTSGQSLEGMDDFDQEDVSIKMDSHVDDANYRIHGRWGTTGRSYNVSNPSKIIRESSLPSEFAPSPKSSKATINSNANLEHEPPDSFTIATQIYTDRITKKSFYLDSKDRDDRSLSIPYMECNSVGTATPHIISSSAYFRAFPRSAHTTSYIYTRGFIVPLTTVEIQTSGSLARKGSITNNAIIAETNSDGRRHTQSGNDNLNGETRIFNAGEVIWVDGEYRMSSADGSKDMTALIVDVPKTKKRHRYKKLVKNPNGTPDERIASIPDFFGFSRLNGVLTCNDDDDDDGRILNTIVRKIKSVSIQRVILTSIGISLSSLMTYFWVKVAPLQLAVGIGGVCMVGGGTLAVVMGGERLCDEILEYTDKLRNEREAMRVAMEDDLVGEDEELLDDALDVDTDVDMATQIDSDKIDDMIEEEVADIQ